MAQARSTLQMVRGDLQILAQQPDESRLSSLAMGIASPLDESVAEPQAPRAHQTPCAAFAWVASRDRTDTKPSLKRSASEMLSLVITSAPDGAGSRACAVDDSFLGPHLFIRAPRPVCSMRIVTARDCLPATPSPKVPAMHDVHVLPADGCASWRRRRTACMRAISCEDLMRRTGLGDPAGEDGPSRKVAKFT